MTGSAARTLDDELGELGFELIQHGRGGTRRYVLKTNPYLQWWVLVHADGTAELTWEFELGAYLQMKGFHISVQDELSLLLFPKGEVRGPAEAGWVPGEIARAQDHLGSVDLASGG